MDWSGFYGESFEQPQGLWAMQAHLIDWHVPFEQVHDDSQERFDC